MDDEKLLKIIPKILSSIEYKRPSNPIFRSMDIKLNTILDTINNKHDFTDETKKECNLDGEIRALELEASPKLIEKLSEINTFIQQKNIQTLDEDDAEEVAAAFSLRWGR